MIKRLLNNLDLEVTPLVAYGLTALFLILGGLGLGRLSDVVLDVGARAQTAKGELYSLSQIQGTDVWEERLRLSLQVRKYADAKILRGTTGGVIAADIQQSLRKIAEDTGIQNLQIQVNSEPEEIDGVDIVQFTLFGLAEDWDTVIDILSAMAANTHSMVIYEMSFSKSMGTRQRSSQFQVAGMIPVKIIAPQIEAEPEPATQEIIP